MSCRSCEKVTRFQLFDGYTAGCQACEARAFVTVSPAEEFEKRRAAWLDANPGAWPLEVRDACARIRDEVGA